MNCGGIVFGTILLLYGLITICTGSIWSQHGKKQLLRDEHPVQFWVAVSIWIVMGIVIIIWSSTHHVGLH